MAAKELRAEVKAGRLDGDVVGGGARRRRAIGWRGAARARRGSPRGRSTCSGSSRAVCRTRRSPARLVISPKTARNHIEHIYAKIGVSNRAGASLFAMQHGLLPDEEPTVP